MVLDRYILRQWFVPFAAFLGIATGLLLFGRALKVLSLVLESGVEWLVIVRMMLAITPYLIVLTLPIAFFFAVQAVLVRLHQESELDALRAAGISWLRILRGPIVMAFALTLLLFYTSMQWMPQGQKAFQGLLFALQQVKSAPGFDPQRFNHDLPDFTVYVEGTGPDGQLMGFMLEDNRPGGPVFYLAESARIDRGDRVLRFLLHRGTRLEGGGDTVRALAFENYQVAMDVGEMGLLSTPQWTTRIFEMDMAELWQARQTNDTPDATAEWHRRLILPTMLLTLLLFALPLSLAPKRSGGAGAYLTGIITILALYNLHIALHHQAASGALPWWGMWLGQAAMVALGAELTRRAMQDRPPRALFQLGEMFYLLHARVLAWFTVKNGKKV